MTRGTFGRTGVLVGGLILGCVALAPVRAAQLVGSETATTRTEPSLAEFAELSPTDRVRAQAWQLSETEWRRYLELMQGIRGSISPSTISPIEVLGIHARDDQERRHYAERWAQAMREDVERILAFQQAYDEAGRRLYPDRSLIDVERLPRRSEKTGALQPDDRLILFTRPACPACDQLLSRLLTHIDRVAGIDLYLGGITPGDDPAVRAWAADQGIHPEWVHSRRVTLNYDAGALERLTEGQGKAPYLLLRRGGELSALSASDL